MGFLSSGGLKAGIGLASAGIQAFGAIKGAQEYKDAVSAGNEEALKLFKRMYRETEPARDVYMRQATADPSVRTPAQERMRDDLMRSGRAQLATTGGRAAGRGGIGAYVDAVARSDERALDANRARQERAASRLATLGYDTVPRMAGIYAAEGDALGRTHAARDTAISGVAADTAGILGGVAANALARMERDKAYKRMGVKGGTV